MRTATVEALYLLSELLYVLHADLTDSLPHFLVGENGVDLENDKARLPATQLLSDMTRLTNTTHRLLGLVVDRLGLTEADIGDPHLERLLGRTGGKFVRQDGSMLADGYTPAKLGVLAWKLRDRLDFLYDRSFETDEELKHAETPYVAELNLE